MWLNAACPSKKLDVNHTRCVTIIPESCLLSEWTRQISPPTGNSLTPQDLVSRKLPGKSWEWRPPSYLLRHPREEVPSRALFNFARHLEVWFSGGCVMDCTYHRFWTIWKTDLQDSKPGGIVCCWQPRAVQLSGLYCWNWWLAEKRSGALSQTSTPSYVLEYPREGSLSWVRHPGGIPSQKKSIQCGLGPNIQPLWPTLASPGRKPWSRTHSDLRATLESGGGSRGCPCIILWT